MQKWLNYQELPGIPGLRKIEDRRKFIESDFKDATVIDLGCWAGQMMTEAKRMGAKKVIGIDGDTDAIEIGKKLGNEIYSNDISNPFFWKTLDKYDVVMLLSVLGNMENPGATLQSASEITKKVLYIEGHGNYHNFSRADWMDMFMKFTDFHSIEYLGETPDRSLFRLARENKTIDYIIGKGYNRIAIIGKPGAGKTFMTKKFKGYKIFTDTMSISGDKYIIDSHGALTLGEVDAVIHVTTDEDTRKDRLLNRKYKKESKMNGKIAVDVFQYSYSPHYIKGAYDYFLIKN